MKVKVIGEPRFEVDGLSFQGRNVNVRFRISLLGQEHNISASAPILADNEGLPDIRAAVRKAMMDVADGLSDLSGKALAASTRPGSWFEEDAESEPKVEVQRG